MSKGRANLSLIYSALAASVPSSSSGGSSDSAGVKNFYIDVDAEIEEYRKLVGRIEAVERDEIEAAFEREVPSTFSSLSAI
jgi:predicted metal-dependent phosphoesterase TrpH